MSGAVAAIDLGTNSTRLLVQDGNNTIERLMTITRLGQDVDAGGRLVDEAIDRVLEVLHSVEQDYDPLWGSTLKQAIRRVHPSFNEEYYGYGSFSDLLEDIKAKGHIELEYDESRGNYKVRRKKGKKR